MGGDDQATGSDNPERHRFELTVAGDVAGFAEYRDRGNRRAFTHTVVDDAYEGQGLGSTLVRFVLDDARTRGLAVRRSAPSSAASSSITLTSTSTSSPRRS